MKVSAEKNHKLCGQHSQHCSFTPQSVESGSGDRTGPFTTFVLTPAGPGCEPHLTQTCSLVMKVHAEKNHKLCGQHSQHCSFTPQSVESGSGDRTGPFTTFVFPAGPGCEPNLTQTCSLVMKVSAEKNHKLCGQHSQHCSFTPQSVESGSGDRTGPFTTFVLTPAGPGCEPNLTQTCSLVMKVSC